MNREQGNTAASKHKIRDKIHEFKREQILEVAGKLFYERGYRSTTVDAIAGQLSVTKPFIYYHFENKLDILQTLLERTIRASLHLFDDIDMESGSPSDVLTELIRKFTLNVIENQTLIALFWRDEKDLPIRNRENVRAMKREFDMRLNRILERGVEAGEFEIEDIALTGLAIAGMVTWTYTWYRPDRRLSSDEIADRLARLTLNMVKARKTRSKK